MKISFLRNTQGTALLEFAILAPTFLLIVFGIIELGLILFAATVLEHAASDASRFGKTGFTPIGLTREQVIRDIIEADIDAFLDPVNITMDTLVYDSFNAVGQEEPFTDTNANGAYDVGETYNDINGNGQWDADMGAVGAGGPGDIVIYNISYRWAIRTPFLDTILSDDGVITLTSSLAVRNEPFDTLVAVGGGP